MLKRFKVRAINNNVYYLAITLYVADITGLPKLTQSGCYIQIKLLYCSNTKSITMLTIIAGTFVTGMTITYTEFSLFIS